MHIPPSLVLGCNTPHGIGVLSDWLEEQMGFAPDFIGHGWTTNQSDQIFMREDYGDPDGDGFGHGYGYGYAVYAIVGGIGLYGNAGTNGRGDGSACGLISGDGTGYGLLYGDGVGSGHGFGNGYRDN